MNPKHEQDAIKKGNSSKNIPQKEASQKGSSQKENALWSKQQVKAAKDFWSKLNEEELEKSAGNKKALTDLVGQRYSITQEAANKQVNSFFEKNPR